MVLTLYKKWFDQILDGSKIVEKRSKTPYWTKRLLSKKIESVEFRNGYGKKVRNFRANISKVTTTKDVILLSISTIFLPVYTYYYYKDKYVVMMVKTFRKGVKK